MPKSNIKAIHLSAIYNGFSFFGLDSDISVDLWDQRTETSSIASPMESRSLDSLIVR